MLCEFIHSLTQFWAMTYSKIQLKPSLFSKVKAMGEGSSSSSSSSRDVLLQQQPLTKLQLWGLSVSASPPFQPTINFSPVVSFVLFNDHHSIRKIIHCIICSIHVWTSSSLCHLATKVWKPHIKYIILPSIGNSWKNVVRKDGSAKQWFCTELQILPELSPNFHITLLGLFLVCRSQSWHSRFSDISSQDIYCPRTIYRTICRHIWHNWALAGRPAGRA